MANLSITTAGNEAVEFLRKEAQLVLPIAFLLIALPGAALQLAIPQPVPGEAPEGGVWLLILVVAVVASMVGTIAIAYLGLRPGASVGEALQVGLRRFIALFLASLLIGLACVLLTIPLILIFGGAAAMGGGADPAAILQSAILVILIVAIVALAVWIRLMLMTPIAAVETAGPIGLITRSWALTKGHFWKLLGFALLLLIAAAVVLFAITAIIGIVVFMAAGQPEPGSTSAVIMAIVAALLQSVVSALFVLLLARIYAQLSASGT